MMVAEAVLRPRNRWLLWLPLVGMVVLFVSGYYPTRRLCGDAGTKAMVIAQVLVAAVVYATLLPAARQVSKGGPAGLKAGLRAGTVRLVLTTALIALVAWRRLAEPRAFLVWTAVAYVVMIKIETLVLLRWGRQAEQR